MHPEFFQIFYSRYLQPIYILYSLHSLIQVWFYYYFHPFFKFYKLISLCLIHHNFFENIYASSCLLSLESFVDSGLINETIFFFFFFYLHLLLFPLLLILISDIFIYNFLDCTPSLYRFSIACLVFLFYQYSNTFDIFHQIFHSVFQFCSVSSLSSS